MKLTPQYIESQVLYCDYQYDGTHTVCTITTHHGSKHVGTSACLDPANYDRAVGEQIARKNAVEQLWALEGYVISKLGLSQIPGIMHEKLGMTAMQTGDVAESIRWNQHFFSLIVYTEPDPAKVHVVNHNTVRLHLDPAHVASGIGRQPQFGRDVLDVVANKDTLGVK